MDGRKRGRNNDAGAVHSNGGFKKHKQVHLDAHLEKIATFCTMSLVATMLLLRCKYGDKCHFAHGEWELNKPVGLPSFDDPRARGGHPMHGRFSGRHEPPVPAGLGAFGESATAKISVDASLAGAIIGKSGVNSKQICRQTGVKLSIRDHDSDSNKRNIELEGTFDQIKLASEMVHDLVASVSANTPFNKAPGGPAPHGPFSTNYRTKLCENFTKGSCTFGDKCHFAHGAAELRKSGV
uniref:C3H1-type domain-containing protein n=1 Tax=Chenopodium quinoa TaxID=63459 RepID=A0A803LM68_CHEQI